MLSKKNNMNKYILTAMLIGSTSLAATAQNAETAPVTTGKGKCASHCCMMSGAKDFVAPSKKFQFGVDWAGSTGRLRDIQTTLAGVKATSSSILDNRMGLIISAGYMFNPYIYLGIGAGAEHQKADYTLAYPTGTETVTHQYHATQWSIPVYAQMRAYFTKKYMAPYIDLRSGIAQEFTLEGTDKATSATINTARATKSYNTTNLYESIAVGARLFSCHKMTFRLQAGYTVGIQTQSIQKLTLANPSLDNTNQPQFLASPSLLTDHRFTLGAGFTF
jgi:hypothetical protein